MPPARSLGCRVQGQGQRQRAAAVADSDAGAAPAADGCHSPLSPSPPRSSAAATGVLDTLEYRRHPIGRLVRDNDNQPDHQGGTDPGPLCRHAPARLCRREESLRFTSALGVAGHGIDHMHERDVAAKSQPDNCARRQCALGKDQKTSLAELLQLRPDRQNHRFGVARTVVDDVVDIVRTTEGVGDAHDGFGESAANSSLLGDRHIEGQINPPALVTRGGVEGP